MEQRRGSVTNGNALTTKSRRGSVINATTIARRNSVIFDDDKDKALKDCEMKLKCTADMLASAEQANARLKQEFEDLAVKFNEVKSCAIDIGWRYCPSYSPEFVFIPKMDPDLLETESRVGKYLLKEMLGRGQFSVVKACQLSNSTIINGQKPIENNLLSPLGECSTEAKDSEGNGGPSPVDAQKRKSSTKSACKIISKDNIYSIFSILRLEQELKALKELQNHKNIVEYRDCFHGTKFFYIVTEYVPTDLFEFLETHAEKINDNIAGVIMRELVEGVAYMASKGIVHRDLKPENILVALSRNDIKVKICDFGLCSFLENGHSILSDFRGSPGFFAPEVLLQKAFCSLKAEIFSLGCIALEMLVSQKFFAEIWMSPYIANMKLSDQNMFNRSIRDAVIESNSYIKSKYNLGVAEFIHETLNIVPQNRRSAMELRNYDWITRTNKLSAADVLNSREPRSINRLSTVATQHTAMPATSGVTRGNGGGGVLSTISKPLPEFEEYAPAFKGRPAVAAYNSPVSFKSTPEETDQTPASKAVPASAHPPSPVLKQQSTKFLDAYTPTSKAISNNISSSFSAIAKPNTPIHSMHSNGMQDILNNKINPSANVHTTDAGNSNPATLPTLKPQTRSSSLRQPSVGYIERKDVERERERQILTQKPGLHGSSPGLATSVSSPNLLSSPNGSGSGLALSGRMPLDINPFSPFAASNIDRDQRFAPALASLSSIRSRDVPVLGLGSGSGIGSPIPHGPTIGSAMPAPSMQGQASLLISRPANSAIPAPFNSLLNVPSNNLNSVYAYNPGLYSFKDVSYDYDKHNMSSLINNLDRSCGYKTLTVKNLQDNQKLYVQNAQERGFDPNSLSSVALNRPPQ